MEVFVEAFEADFVEASMEVSSAAVSTTSMEASTEAFEKPVSMEAYAKGSVEASGICFSIEASVSSMRAFTVFHGIFH